MSHFYERILNKEFDYNLELQKLNILCREEMHHFMYYSSTLFEYINHEEFRKLKLSYNYLCINDLLDDIVYTEENNRERYIYYCEFFLSLIKQASSNSETYNEVVYDILKIIINNLDKLSLDFKYIDDDKLGKVAIIIPKNEILENVLNCSNNTTISDYLIEYGSSHNDGNISRKEELLKLLANSVEEITKNPNYKDYDKILFSDTNFLYNNLNLRHNQKVNDTRYYDVTYADREKWLDLTYRNTLLVLNTIVKKEDSLKVEKLKKTICMEDN